MLIYHMDTPQQEPLATVSYEWTEEIYERSAITMNYMYERKFRLLNFVFTSGVALWLFLIGLILGDIFNIVVGIVIFLIALWARKASSISTVYKSSKIFHGLTEQFNFYDSCVVHTTEYGQDIVPYDKLYTIKSSKYGYMLCISKVSGYFIPQQKCTDNLIQLFEHIKTEGKVNSL